MASSDTSAQTNGSSPLNQAALPTERADEMLTQTGERIGRWLAAASREVRKAAALAREEAEDIWAEAQAVRKGETVPMEEPPLETPQQGVPV